MSTSKNLEKGSQKQVFHYVWLVYLGFVFVDPVLSHSTQLWVRTLLVVAVFLVCYVGFICTKRDSLQRLWLLPIFALGMITLPWNSGASCFFVYVTSLLPFAMESAGVIVALFALQSMAVAAEGLFLHVSWISVAMTIFLSLVIGTGNIFFAAQRRADCKLREAQEENIALAAVAERERIARDLHDVLGHTLSLIVLKAELAGRLMARDPQRAAAEIAEVEHTARTALSEVREAIGGYRARGLLAEIEAARRTLDAAGVTLHCDELPAGASAVLQPNEETVLALALREAVTNIVRHARASTCTLRFTTVRGERRLVVEDNGQHAELREGNGLRGMRERVEALGGKLLLEREGGTRLLIALPAHAEAAV